MKIASAIVLLCIAAPLSAGQRCEKHNAGRIEMARSPTVKPMVDRAGSQRSRNVILLSAWQRAFLFEPQIL